MNQQSKRGRPTLTPEVRQKIIRLRRHLSVAEIAARLGVCRMTVYRVLENEHGQ